MDLTKYKVGEIISWRVAVYSPNKTKVYYFYIPAKKAGYVETEILAKASILAIQALPLTWPNHAKMRDYVEIAGALQCAQLERGNRKWKVARLTVSEKHGTVVSGRDC
jgi:hypothetical protein